MPGVPAPEEWLRQQLLALSQQGNSALDAETVHGLVDYCAMANEEDAAEFILNIVGSQAAGILDVYTAKRRSASGQAAPSSSAGGSQSNQPQLQSSSGKNLQAYIKPSFDTANVLGGGKKAGKVAKKAEESPAVGESSTSQQDANLTTLGKVGGRKKKNKGQLRVEDVAAGRVLLANRKLCDCQARRHALVTNCLSCGKIVCEQEGEGPCMFCGALVSREGGDFAPPKNETDEEFAAKLDAEEKANAFKDRLVEYDRTAAQRTAVIDDQSDFFNMDIDGDAWMSEEEKRKLRAQNALAAHAEREKRKKVQVTFDLIGRKVILAGDEEQEAGSSASDNSSFLNDSSDPAPTPASKIVPNPLLKGPPPIFIDSAKSQHKKLPGGLRGGTTETDGEPGKDPPGSKGIFQGVRESKDRFERVQHDSTYFGTVDLQGAGLDAEAEGAATRDGETKQERSETVRIAGKDIDVEEFGSEPACGTSIPLLGQQIAKVDINASR